MDSTEVHFLDALRRISTFAGPGVEGKAFAAALAVVKRPGDDHEARCNEFDAANAPATEVEGDEVTENRRSGLVENRRRVLQRQ